MTDTSSVDKPSRRLFLAAGSAGAVFGALSQAAAADDPIFAAIAEQRRCKALADDALAVCNRIIDEASGKEEIDEAEDAFSEKNKAYFYAEMAVLATQPTTAAGALALLAFLAEHLEGPHCDPGEDYPAPLLGAIRNALAALKGEALA